MKNTVQAIILAAGKSTRLNIEKTKLAEPICGKPMILFSTQLLQSLNIDTTVVVGHEKEVLQNIINCHHHNTITFAHQSEQLGTGHALACSQSLWTKENILIINGDMPLINSSVIIELYETHQTHNAAVSFVSSCTTNTQISKPYGRVVQKENSIEIIEAKDLIGDPSAFCCINAGIYLIKKDFLSHYIDKLNNNNASNEFYITDLIKIASDNNQQVTKVSAPFDTIRGVNTMEELIAAERIKQHTIFEHWIHHGVRFSPHFNLRIDEDVVIGNGSIINDGVHLLGNTTIGNNVHIHPFSIIKNSSIESYTEIEPFTYLNNNILVKPFSITENTIEQQSSFSTKKYITKETKDNTLSSEFSFIGARLVHHDIPTEEQ